MESCLVTTSQLLEAIISLLLKVWLLLNLCLVKTVDDGVLALGNQDALYFAGVLEADLADLHAAVFLEVGPWCVDDCDVVFLVALCGMSDMPWEGIKGRKCTLDGIGLCQLGEIHDEFFREGVPCLAFLHA